MDTKDKGSLATVNEKKARVNDWFSLNHLP